MTITKHLSAVGLGVLLNALLTTGGDTSVKAQQNSPSIAELQDQISTLTAALKACQGSTARQSVTSAREDALAALRAVDSVVGGGANMDEFKKYQLDAKVKVDALPDLPENLSLRRVSQVYIDASMLLTASLTQRLGAAEVMYLKGQYGTLGSERLAALPSEGFDSGSNPGTLEEALAATNARFFALAELLPLAKAELQNLK